MFEGFLDRMPTTGDGRATQVRIGFATDNYAPYVSGVINFIIANRHYLEDHGHEVWVFAFGEPGAVSADPRVVLSPGIKIHGTEGFRLGTRLTRKVHRLLATMDVVHIDDPFWSGRLALAVCRRHGVPVVFTNHTRVDLYPDYFLKMFPHGSLDEPLASYMRRFCQRVDLVISPTESVAGVLRDLGVDAPIRVVRNGVDIAPFLLAARRRTSGVGRSEARRSWNIDEGDVVFAYSGRLSPEKNLSVLVDAFASVAHDLRDVRLVLIGDGPAREDVELAVALARLVDRVRITGMVAHGQMPSQLLPCDVWVTASTTEVDPLTVIEAMAAGLPAIGPDAPGIVDTLEDGVTGLLAPSADAAAIAECMRVLALDGTRREAMGRAAREASRRYSIEVTGAEMLGIYQELAATPRSRPPQTLSSR